MCVWHELLSVADVKDLWRGIPPTAIRPNALSARWILPQTGELNNTATGTLSVYFGTLTNSGTTTAADPVWPEVFYKTVPEYAPRLFAPWDNPSAPCRDKLIFCYPGVPPYSQAYSRDRDNAVNLAVWPHVLQGEDNSLRRPPAPNLQYVDLTAIPTGYNGTVWACWVKVYSWVNNSGTYYFNRVNLFAQNCLSSYFCLLGYWVDDAYGAPRQFYINQLHADAPVNVPGIIPTGEWVHIACQIKYPYLQRPAISRVYWNGEFVFEGNSGIDRDAYQVDAVNVQLAGYNLGAYAGGDFAAKDFREYMGVLSDADFRAIYEDSLEFHRATSGLINTATRPVRVEYTPDPTAVPDLYSPNTELTWVQKATHIWALHPSAPTRADKGGMTLELVGTGTLPTAVEPDNTIQFYGGNQTAARWYRTIGTLALGGTTLPAIGGMSCWVKHDTYTQFMGLIGASAGIGGFPHLFTQSAGYVIGRMAGAQPVYLTAISTGWVHLACQSDTSTCRLYVNGVKVGEVATGTTAPTADFFNLAHDFYGSGSNNNALIGQLRQVAVINGATWTDAEILEMYQRPFAYYGPPAPAHLVNTLGQGLEIVSHNFSILYGPVAVNVLGQVLEVVSRDPSYIAGTIPVNVLAQNIEVVSHAIGAMVVPPFSLTLATQILELVRHDPAVVPGVTSINILRQTLEVVSRDPAVTAGPITVQALAHTIEVVARTLDGVISAPLAFQVATQILEMIAPAIKVFRPVVAPGRDYCIPAEDRTMEIAADGSVNCMSTICMGGSDVPFFVKSPAAVLDYKWDWTAWLGSDTILSHTVVCEDGGVVIDGSVHDLTTVVARISGGMTGDTCQVNCTIETEGNRTDQRTAVFLIQPK
jgi:hypothetical protein